LRTVKLHRGIEEGDMADAAQRTWVQQVFGLALDGSPEGAEQTGASAQANGLLGRLTDLAAQASVLPEPTRSALLQRIKQAQHQPTVNEIEAIADAVADAAKASRQQDARTQAGNTVTFRLLQRKWQNAEQQAHQHFDTFLDELLGDPDLQADERFPQLQAEAGRLADLIPDDGGMLTATLGVLDDADERQRPQARQRAMAALQTYQADVAAARALQDLQGLADKYYGSHPFLAELQKALADLGGELAKRA
jgi:hypothetical protein